MKQLRISTVFAALALGGSLLGAAEIKDTPISLLRNDTFEPVTMHGMKSAARGWALSDPGREAWIRAEKVYLSGEECFTLSFDKAGMTLRFKDKLPVAYKKFPHWLSLSSRTASQLPPAPEYRTAGRIRLDKGSIRLVGDRAYKPSPEWQKIDFVQKFDIGSDDFGGSGKIGSAFQFPAVAGASYTFGELHATAVYPKVGGEIALPDGGRLTRLLLPENADYITRWSVAMWRGWLWKLTGVALPIETVKEVKPAPGAFAAVPGKTANGGWQLTVDKNGITLVYCEKAAIVPALFDYLRLAHGCAFYAPDCVKPPKAGYGAVKELGAFTRVAEPHFRFITCGTPWILCSGGWDPTILYARNDVDYYHLFAPKWDHTMNIIMPGEIYFPKHPEYFMLARNGKRFCHSNPYYTNPCFSSKEGMKTLVDNLLKYTDEQTLYRRITMATGDVWEHCQCPDCVKLNGGTDTNSDSQMIFLNLFSKALKERHPEMIIEHDVYASRHTVPKHVPNEALDNVNYFYCLTGQVAPCTIHIDCKYNKALIEEIAGWNRYINGRKEQLGFMTYLDIRPLHHLRQMEYLTRYGTGEVYLFDYQGFPASANFASARWNLGEDPAKLMEEFDLYYFGKGGPAMHKITLLVDEFTRNYKHTPDDFRGNRHFGVWGGTKNFTRTALTRGIFDKIYALFDEAMAAVKGEREYEARIANEIKLYMAADLNRYNVTTCKNEKELKAFAERLSRYIRLAQKYPERFRQVSVSLDIREQVNNASGLAIPKAPGFWANHPVVKKFLADPMKSLIANADRIPGGWYYRPLAIRGGGSPSFYSYECPTRQCVALRRERFGQDCATLQLTLPEAPAAPLLLALEGLDDDKPGATLLEVAVNGKPVFFGKNTFPEHTWGRMGFTLPAAALRKGENTITLRNVTPDEPSRSTLFEGDSEAGKADPQWGWIAISEAYVLDPAGDFEAYKNGDLKQAWHLGFPGKPPVKPGEAVPGGGKVVLKGVSDSPTGLVYFSQHARPKIAVAPGSKVRITVEAAGSGKLRGQLWCYRPQPGSANKPEIPQSGYCGKTPGIGRKFPSSKPAELAEAPRTIVFEFTTPPSAGLIIPRIELVGEGEATLTKLAVEVTPPADK